MAGNNGDSSELNERDLRLAAAIGGAVADVLVPEIAKVTRAVETMRVEFGGKLDEHGRKLDEHGKKLDVVITRIEQLQSGAVGVGRITALEDRVSELERKLKT